MSIILLDSGISWRQKLKKNVEVLDVGNGWLDDANHGSLVMDTLRFFTNENILSIKVLDENKSCRVRDVIEALNVCKTIDAKYINISFSILKFAFEEDKEKLNFVIKSLVDQNKIIIASVNNDNFKKESDYFYLNNNVVTVDTYDIGSNEYTKMINEKNIRIRAFYNFNSKNILVSTNSLYAPIITGILASNNSGNNCEEYLLELSNILAYEENRFLNDYKNSIHRLKNDAEQLKNLFLKYDISEKKVINSEYIYIRELKKMLRIINKVYRKNIKLRQISYEDLLSYEKLIYRIYKDDFIDLERYKVLSTSVKGV